MKSIATLVFFVFVCCVLTVDYAAAQITIKKPEQAQKEEKQALQEESVASLVKKLAVDKEWWAAKKKLVSIAEGRHMEVLRALQAVWLSTDDPVLRNRNKAVADEVNRVSLGKLKKKEQKDRMARVKTALEKIQAALGEGSDPATLEAVKKAADEMAEAVQGLQKSISTKLPLGVRTRFTPPGGGMQIEMQTSEPEPETEPETGEKKEEAAKGGFRMIKDGDKTILIRDKDTGGEGEKVKVIEKDGKIFIIRKEAKEKAEEKEKKEKEKKNL